MTHYCICGHGVEEHDDLETMMPCAHKMDAVMGDIEDCQCQDYEEAT